jgi:hypothetical protein
MISGWCWMWTSAPFHAKDLTMNKICEFDKCTE